MTDRAMTEGGYRTLSSTQWLGDVEEEEVKENVT